MYVEHRGRVMASELHVVLSSTDAESASRAIARVVELLDHLEQRWSRFLPDSDVTRLNLAAGRTLTVDPTTVTLLLAMVDAWRATDRRFDPTTLPDLVAAGYRSSIDDSRRVTLMRSGDLHIGGFDHDEPPTLGDVHIDRERNEVRLPAGMAIDAGGIGKGLAADLAVIDALDVGVDGALVGIGGDLSMGGHPPTGGWTVEVERPDVDGAIIGTTTVSGGGVATSSTRSRRWRHEGRERHHVIDPWTGEPSTTDLASVTVIARAGWLAEVHATEGILGGSGHVVDLLERRGLSGVAVTDDGRVLTTDDLADLRRAPAAALGGAS
jgi:thiamine biosynthesis lipoprotein